MFLKYFRSRRKLRTNTLVQTVICFVRRLKVLHVNHAGQVASWNFFFLRGTKVMNIIRLGKVLFIFVQILNKVFIDFESFFFLLDVFHLQSFVSFGCLKKYFFPRLRLGFGTELLLYFH